MRDDTKRGCHTPEPICAEGVQANEEAPEDGISFKAKYRENLYDFFFVSLFCLLDHRLAVRISLPFYILKTIDQSTSTFALLKVPRNRCAESLYPFPSLFLEWEIVSPVFWVRFGNRA